ncbi:MAG: hypothetical protein CMO01_27185 [Thalassobius sp.]|nr:hypothetical protein [Thalassovita sp.]
MKILYQMRKYILIIIIGALSVQSNSSLAQGVVSAPILESQMGTQNGIVSAMNATIAAMEKAEAKVRQALQKVEWAKNLQTMRRLLTVIEGTVCTTKDLTLNMDAAASNCFVSFNYDVAIVKMTASIDFVNIVLMSDVLMTQSDRIKTMNDALVLFEEAQQTLAELNQAVNQVRNSLDEEGDWKKAAIEMSSLSRY